MNSKKKFKRGLKNSQKEIPIHKKKWDELSPEEKLQRQKALDVLATSRGSKKSVSRIARDNNTTLATVLKHTRAFRKVGRRWVPNKTDKTHRKMLINENGKEKSIEINNSKTASTIGSYKNSIRQFLETGNSKKLSKFSKKKIKDSNGNIHSLDTDPDVITAIQERIEPEPDRPEVYST